MLTATAWLLNQTPMCNKKASAYLRRLTDAKKLKTPFYDKLTKNYVSFIAAILRR